MSNKDSILELQNVCFDYPDGSIGLKACSLSLQKGSKTAVLGINGSGKTTLFLHLIGILRPQSGSVIFDGTPLSYSRQALHNLRSRIGFVFQNPDSQLFSASVREDVSFGPMNQNLSKQVVAQRVEEALRKVAMTDCANKPVHNLSYGQKKRVCIAGVLAMQTKIMILDEPMAGLDKAMQNDLEALLCQLHADGLTIILSTHDMAFAYRWADNFVLLDQGACVKNCTVASLMDATEILESLGLGIPDVLKLHKNLILRGILPSNGLGPRSIEELFNALKEN